MKCCPIVWIILRPGTQNDRSLVPEINLLIICMISSDTYGLKHGSRAIVLKYFAKFIINTFKIKISFDDSADQKKLEDWQQN